jgi:hypothetical protein
VRSKVLGHLDTPQECEDFFTADSTNDSIAASNRILGSSLVECQIKCSWQDRLHQGNTHSFSNLASRYPIGIS